MRDWASLTLLFYIFMRMTGFIVFSPLFSRSNVPNLARSALVLALTLSVYAAYDGTAAGYAAVMGRTLPAGYSAVLDPATLLELVLRLIRELAVGFLLGYLTRFSFALVEQAGELVDTQMGMSMARNYDPASQSNMTVTANLLNVLMTLMFFTVNGHVTLMRIIMTSGEAIPFGTVAVGPDISEYALQMFAHYVVLAVKLGFPILAAELMGQIGMGVLMKVIPQINVFAINIELKVIIGLLLLLFLVSPIGIYLRDVCLALAEELRHGIDILAAIG